ncbi:unnamed protein product [Gongylonema pulchrum]|uniref:Uncharacterized protein n=1 Tax=Gongylonema pulchrum TaxID=637853 RepID=A0A183DNE8_9BILA|nr:unnamed protein product [Gongylonema pulchrum]
MSSRIVESNPSECTRGKEGGSTEVLGQTTFDKSFLTCIIDYNISRFHPASSSPRPSSGLLKVQAGFLPYTFRLFHQQ